MSDSELDQKFLSKIEAMTFEEIDERASRACDCGASSWVNNIDNVDDFMRKINHINNSSESETVDSFIERMTR